MQRRISPPCCAHVLPRFKHCHFSLTGENARPAISEHACAAESRELPHVFTSAA
jgi:hypothetical protein